MTSVDDAARDDDGAGPFDRRRFLRRSAGLSVAAVGATWVAPTVVTRRAAADSSAAVPPRWVAVGDSGVILTRDVAGSWIARTSTVGGHLEAVAYGGAGKWVVVGFGGVVLTSTDNATTWTSHALGGGITFSGVAYGAGWWVAVDTAGVIRTSTDGISWVAQSALVPSSILTAVTFDAATQRFTAVGRSGRIWTSTDATATAWTQQTSTTTVDFFAVHANAAGRTAVGESLVATSTDGVAWSTVAVPGRQLGVTSNPGGTRVSVGYLPSPPSDRRVIYAAAPASSWALRDPLPPAPSVAGILEAVANDGVGQFIAVGDVGLMRASNDGLTWSPETSGVSTNLYGVAHGH